MGRNSSLKPPAKKKQPSSKPCSSRHIYSSPLKPSESRAAKMFSFKQGTNLTLARPLDEQESLGIGHKNEYNFEKWSLEESKIFKNNAKFSFCSLIIMLLYILSFLLENRSGDLTLMKNALEPAIFLKNKASSAGQPKQIVFKEITDTYDGFLFCIEKLTFFFTDYKEKMPDKNFVESAFYTGSYREFYNFTEWRIIQSFNLLMGARIKVTIDGSALNQTDDIKFNEFYPSNIETSTVAAQLSELQNNVIVKNNATSVTLKSVSFELLFYNYNKETAQLQNIGFSADLKGFNKETSAILFLPRFNDVHSKYLTLQIIVWVIRLIYLLNLLGFIYSFVSDFIILTQTSWFEFKNRFDIRYIIYMVYAVINLYFFYEYIMLLLSTPLFSGSPMKTEQDFNRWLDIGDRQKDLYAINGLTIILIVIRLTEMIQVAFRSTLSTIFYSLGVVKKVLGSYFLIILLFMVYFIIDANLNISSQEKKFSSFGKSAELVLLSIFQNIEFTSDSLLPAHDLRFSFFFYTLFLTFNTFVMQFFLAIMVSPFLAISDKYQFAIEASVKYENQSNIGMGTKLWHLLSFRYFNKEAYNERTRQKIKKNEIVNKNNMVKINRLIKKEIITAKDIHGFEQEDSEEDEENVEVFEKKKESKVQKKSMKEILFGNLDLLGLTKNSQVETNLVSRDIYIDNIQRVMNGVKMKKAYDVRMKTIEARSNVPGNCCSTVCYILYIFLFVTVLSRQLNIPKNFKSRSAMRSFVKNFEFTNPDYEQKLNYFDMATLSDTKSFFLNVE